MISEMNYDIYVCSVAIIDKKIAIGSKNGLVHLFEIVDDQLNFVKLID